MSLDRIVEELCAELSADGMVIAPPVAKATIQAARVTICRQPTLAEAELVDTVQRRLRRAHILLPAAMVGALLRRYLTKVLELDITEVTDHQAV